MAEYVPTPSAPAPERAAEAAAPRGAPNAAAPRVGSLYVSNLAPTVTESALYEFFRTVGEKSIASIRVCRDNQHPERRSLGYAYVNFHNEKDADRAMDTLNFEEIEGKQCRISWSKRDPSVRKSGVGNLFIKNLDKDIDDVGLFDTFSKFGVILSSKIACDRFTNESKGYGFVHFENVEDSEKAIAALDGKCLNGKQVYVGPFIPKHKRPNKDANNFTNIYIKHIHPDVTQETFVELLTKLTEDIGKITSPKLMTKEVEKDGNVVVESRKFGFVNFENHEIAAQALKRLEDQAKVDELAPGLTAEGCELYSSVAVPKYKRNQLYQQKPQNLNLYIKNISEEVTEDQLREAFSRFGTITSLRIMEDDKKIKRGFGFVCYDNADSARNAMTDMNSANLAGKPLYVALAQKKEIRRQQLAQQLAARPIHMPNMGVPYGFFPHGPPRGRIPGNFAPRTPYPAQFQRQFMVPVPGPRAMVNPGAPNMDLDKIPAENRLQRLEDLIRDKSMSEGMNEFEARKFVGSLLDKAKAMPLNDKIVFLLSHLKEDRPKVADQ